MNIKRVKQGARITFYNGIYMILLGLYYTFFTNLNMKLNFDFISQLWGFFLKYNSEIAYLFRLFNVLVGILLISTGIIIIYLSDFIIKRKEKMTWIMLFLSGVIAWGGLLIITILSANLILTIPILFGWAMFIIGMLLPIRYYLEREYKEY